MYVPEIFFFSSSSFLLILVVYVVCLLVFLIFLRFCVLFFPSFMSARAAPRSCIVRLHCNQSRRTTTTTDDNSFRILLPASLSSSSFSHLLLFFLGLLLPKICLFVYERERKRERPSNVYNASAIQSKNK